MSCHFVCFFDTESWTAENLAFPVETYLKNNDSVVTIQRVFRRDINLERHGNVPDILTIGRWVRFVRLAASAYDRSLRERAKIQCKHRK